MQSTDNLFNLRKLIEEQGAISISSFMEESLYNNQYGYYITKDPIGKNNDFITSPEISQLFGEMIGMWSVIKWIEMGRPNPFNLIELGPGHGTLMDDLIRSTKNVEGFHQSIKITMVEISPFLKKIQQSKLAKWENIEINWYSSVQSVKTLDSIIIANEFFDALPIKQYIKIKNIWHEILVNIMPQNGELFFTELPLDPDFSNILNEEYPNSKHRSILEISNVSQNIIKSTIDLFEKNKFSMLIIDYGYYLNPLNRVDFNSTLQAVKDHNYHPIFQSYGTSDITAHVDFFSLAKAAEARRCKIQGILTQGEFLEKMGIKLRFSALSRNKSKEQIKDLKLGMERLIDRDKMGKLFKVLEIDNL